MPIETRIFVAVFMSYYFFVNPTSYAETNRDTILRGQQPLRDWESLNSASKVFTLRFFSLGSSKNRYLGLFCGHDKQAVWIANRISPIADASGSLLIDAYGNLKLTYTGGNILSVMDSAPATSTNISATLLDDGNFVPREMNPNGSINRTLWQSFDYPTDALLPGMKLGINFKTGPQWSLTSWISSKVPAAGSFTIREIYLLIGRESNWWKWFITALGGTILVTFSIICYCVYGKLKAKGMERAKNRALLHDLEDTVTPPGKYSKSGDKIGKKMSQLNFYSLESISAATNNFSTANKLGEGGFGPVYKGTLHGGQEIAVKRLSRNSRQGLTEFENEILLIAKLQHTNLVRLLGCCIQGREKILVYEYMPNKSLDFFLFDPSRRKLINWTNRKNIIEGVAQGLLYLHEYSRLKVIHRDLKSSNILLDHELNPKISDFELARIFGVQQYEANTNRIVGTYGYMAPEYAMKGIVSLKTDVFSFGVLLLEIVSGKKNYS